MDEALRARLVAHGALVFLVGLLAGFPFAFHELGKIALWPFIDGIPVSIPGSTRAWRMAHLEGILNGMLLFALAAVTPLLRLGGREPALLYWSLLATAWGNILASLLGPLSGGRGLEFGSDAANSVMYLLFVAAIIGAISAAVVVLRGAWRRASA